MSTPQIDPLITRSLPGHFWENIPESWQSFDKNLQLNLENSINLHDTPWSQFRWLTESTNGILIISILLLILFCLSHFDELQLLKNKITKKSTWIHILVFILGLGFSDLVAMRLKIFFGRLKPHVNFYNPDYLPALSLPSNHAFNSAFLLCLMYSIQHKPLRKNQKIFYFFLSFSILLVGFSRVLFGQHYPLDIFTGWLLGTLFAKLYSKIFPRL
jgi:membrane-associated phospholipid phosphatase